MAYLQPQSSFQGTVVTPATAQISVVNCEEAAPPSLTLVNVTAVTSIPYRWTVNATATPRTLSLRYTSTGECVCHPVWVPDC